MSLPPLADFSQSHTSFLLSFSHSPFSPHISIYFLILFFLFYAPFLLCPATPQMRSYLYLEKYPWTSKQKDPQSFSSFPNWLIISWILYYINCSFQPHSVVWQPFHYSNGELILTQRGMLVESWLYVSQRNLHIWVTYVFPHLCWLDVSHWYSNLEKVYDPDSLNYHKFQKWC